MAINPVRFAQHVNEQFLRYQLTAFPITDPDLAQQAQELLRGKFEPPLVKGPYISLAKPYKFGPHLEDLARQGVVHPALPGIAEYPSLFAHQWETLQAVQNGRHCLVSAGTGTGKTEAFLYPIIDHCLHLRDAGEPDGIVAIIVYPMNALAIDQLERLRKLLAGTGITFGMYVGSTPADDSDAANYYRMAEGEGQKEYDAHVGRLADQPDTIVSPWEERVTEANMRERPPRLLLTNVRQLEFLMTRSKDVPMFRDAPLKFLVFDEAHTYSGVAGAETACLIRRIRAFCRKTSDEVICIGTSATLTDPETGEAAGAKFAERFFGVDPDRVSLIQEEHEDVDWPQQRHTPPVPTADTLQTLETALRGIEEGDVALIRDAHSDLTGAALPAGGDTYQHLYDALMANEMAYHICDLAEPKHMVEAVDIIWRRLGRQEDHSEQAQAELLCYLTLGAAARRDGNPLMRPKLHYFIRGLEGAAVVFDTPNGGPPEPKLYLSAQKALEDYTSRQPSSVFPVWVCKTCGQHFFRTWVAGLEFDGTQPQGGDAEDANVVWPPVPEDAGTRVTFTNRYISELWEEEQDGEEAERTRERLDRARTEMHICRHCGALHRNGASECAYGPCKRPDELIPVYVVTTEGDLNRCPTCGERKRGYRGRTYEPIRPLRATTVADVHILAQDMLNAADPPHQRLICFADNRQDAAFQAGWMQDHARRYRLRHLIHDIIDKEGRPVSIGDVQNSLLQLFDREPELARALAPEVFEGRAEEAFGRNLRDNLTYYLRIALVLELTTSFKQRDSLETWGVGRVVYNGVEPGDSDIIAWAGRLGLSPEVLADGISSLLDVYRRNRYFHDEIAPVFGQWWREGDEQIMRGYMPFWDFPPKGLKLRREAGAQDDHVVQLVSERGQTLTHNFVSKWWTDDRRPDTQDIRQFVEELWEKLTAALNILTPVTLVGGGGGALRGTQGTHQVDAAQIGLVTQHERYRCNTCRRVHTRPTPQDCCTAMHCRGTLVREKPPEYDYNVHLLGQPFTMVMAEEHTAQVPAARREALEREFKDPEGRVNCFVATPTLELGVNIGALDMVLMRNVPPRSSNYWQRSGRAGREHRMAVIYTYCRRSIHDQYFFDDPARILGGAIEPPQFNLKNDIMLRKHVHAAVLSELIALSRYQPGDEGLSQHDIEELRDAQQAVFPLFVGEYLFTDGRQYRFEPYDVSALSTLTTKHRDRLLPVLESVFSAHWPANAAEEVSRQALGAILDGMASALQGTVDLLHRRLIWAVQTRRRLLEQEERGLLDEHDSRIRSRCEAYLRGLAERKPQTYTLSVLAGEGFLPGYGAYEGGIAGFAQRALTGRRRDEAFQLSRPSALAVREFVPGNMIYANRGRYRLTQYHFPVGEEHLSPDLYTVDLEKDLVREARTPSDGYAPETEGSIQGVPISDNDLAFISNISDAEDYRFQIAVRMLGYLRAAHSGGESYSIDSRELRHMRGQRLRLVNVGPADRVREGHLGYPICLVCGATRSPYASEAEFEHFEERHREACGTAPEWAALSADAQVDGFVMEGFDERSAAVNFGEALCIGATQILDMDRDDLHYVAISAGDDCRLFFYDPMPGGSGLLTQMLERWGEVLDAARPALADCPNACEASCYDCMRTYYNMPHHREFDRHKAAELLEILAGPPAFEYEIPPVAEAEAPAGTDNQANADRLLTLIERAGFRSPDREQPIEIGKPYDRTIPDFSYCEEAEDIFVAIYLDGLSAEIHGNASQAQTDRIIRQQLEVDGWDVIVIASSDLDDLTVMRSHFRRLARALGAKEAGSRVRDEDDWFRRAGGPNDDEHG